VAPGASDIAGAVVVFGQGTVRVGVPGLDLQGAFELAQAFILQSLAHKDEADLAAQTRIVRRQN
jgi:hypothetical protein